jgi:Na+/H+-dicarboxylate symporter
MSAADRQRERRPGPDGADHAPSVNNLAIAIGLVAGLAVGLGAALTGAAPLVSLSAWVAPLGELFVRAIRMVVIPLVAATVFEGVARIGHPRRLGRLGGLALAFFWVTSLIGTALGMGAMAVAGTLAPTVTPSGADAAAAAEVPGLVDMLLSLVPVHPIAAAAEGRLLPLLVFTVLFGAAAAALPEERRKPLVDLAASASAALIRLVHWILWTAPVGIFALAASLTAGTGAAILGSLAVFAVAVILGLFLLVALAFMPAVVVLGRMAPRRFVRGTAAGAMVGFGATSSMAALPVLLESADEELELDPGVSSLVLSLGASINRSGSALFQGAALVFLAQLYGVPLPFPALVAGFVAVFFASMTVAPIPSASIFTLAPALAATGVPADGLGLLLGIDRIPDMFRSGTNQVGHMAAAVVVDGRARPEHVRG